MELSGLLLCAVGLPTLGDIHVDLIVVAITVLIGVAASNAAARLIHVALNGSSMGEVSIVVNLVRVFIALVVAYIVGQNVFNIELGGVAQALGITTLVVSLGLQELIKNVVAGVQIVITRLFSVGDQLEIGGLRGEVVDINWRQTTMRDKDDNLHVVPNATIMGDSFMRFEGKMAQRYTIDCEIKSDLDLQRVAADIERLADEALDERGLRAEEHSEVRFLDSTANGVHASVRIFLKDIELTTRGKDAVMRAISQRGYLADWTNEMPAQEKWR